MRNRRPNYTEAQKQHILDRVNTLQGEGIPLTRALKQVNIDAGTFYRWSDASNSTTSGTIAAAARQLPIAASSFNGQGVYVVFGAVPEVSEVLNRVFDHQRLAMTTTTL